LNNRAYLRIKIIGTQQDQQGEVYFQDDFAALETSRFNNNLLTTDNNVQYSQSVQEIVSAKQQSNIYIEANTARVEKSSNHAILVSNFAFETNIARGMNEMVMARPRTKTQSEQTLTIPFTSINSPNSFEGQDPYLFKRDPSKVLEITSETGGGIRIKNNEIVNQKRLICSPKVTKLERITEIRTDISQNKTVRGSEKSATRTRSNTPNSTSRNNRSGHDGTSRSRDPQQRARYINPAKLRESRTAPEGLKNDTGSIIEKIKKQTEFNAYTSYNDKFHIKVQRVGSHDTQEKSFQSNHTQKSQASLHSYASKKTGNGNSVKRIRREQLNKEENSEGNYKKQSVQYEDLIDPDQINLGLNNPHFWAMPLRVGEHLYEKSSSGMGEIESSSRDYNISKTMLEQPSEYPSETLSQVLDEGSYKNIAVRPSMAQVQQLQLRNIAQLNVKEAGNSKGSTARSIMNHRELSLDKKIDELEELEEGLWSGNKSSKFKKIEASGLAFLKSDKSKAKIKTVQEQRDSFKRKEIVNDAKAEFKLTFMTNWEGHNSTVTSIVKDINHETVWTASKDRTLRGWDMKTIFERRNSYGSIASSKTDQIVLKDKKGIEVLMYDPNNRIILSGGADHDIKVWEPSTGKMVSVLKGHQGGIFGLAKMGHNAFLSCSGDQTIRKWDLHKEVCIDVWNEHRNRVTGILYDREKFAHSFLSCCADGKIKMWDFRTDKSVATFDDHDLDVTSLIFMGKSYNMVSGSFDKTVKIWDLNMRKVENSINIESQVHALAYHTKNDKLIVGSNDLKMIDVEDNFRMEVHDEDENRHQGSIKALYVDEELDLLYSGSTDNIVKVWLMRTSM